MTYLSVPQVERPAFEVDQDSALNWLAKAHAHFDSSLDPELIQKLLYRYGCRSDRIKSRGTVLEDCTHSKWDQMQIFKKPAPLLSDRMKLFEKISDATFERFYADAKTGPSDLIHVSCTGYVSPSGAQKLVSNRGWETEVLHAYHMGCYASIPALRMARGLLAAGRVQVDVVHTETCTLHMNPARHEPEQLVVQSLFADGFCKYEVTQSRPKAGFEILNLREEIMPESQDAMTWSLAESGFHMTLHRDVPDKIKEALPNFLTRLTGERTWKDFDFAIHPGGPRIIEGVQASLELTPAQTASSHETLRSYGNMSSATLPHVLNHLASSSGQERIIGLAFGPGLTICGMMLRRL